MDSFRGSSRLVGASNVSGPGLRPAEAGEGQDLTPTSDSHVARQVARGGAFLGFEQVAYVILGLAFMMLLVRHAGVTGFGVWSIAWAIASVAGIGTTALHLALERFVPEFAISGERRGALRLAGFVIAAKCALAGAIACILWVSAEAIGRLYSEPFLAGLLKLFALWLVADSVASLGRSLLFGLQRFGFRSWMTALQGTMNVAAVLLAMLLGRDLAFVTLGFVLSTFIPGASQLVFGLRLLWGLPDARQGTIGLRPLGRCLRYALPLTVNQGLYALYLNMGRLVLGYWLGAQAAGYFSFALNIVERLTGVVASVSSVLLPSLVQLAGQGQMAMRDHLVRKATQYLMALGALLALVLFVFSSELTLILGGSEYLPGLVVLQVLAFQPLFRFPSQVLSTVFLASERTNSLLVVSVLKILAELAGYVMLIPTLGVAGAALSHVLSYLLALVLLLRLGASKAPASPKLVLSDLSRLGLLLLFVSTGAALSSHLVGPAWGHLAVGVISVFTTVAGIFALRIVDRRDAESILALDIGPCWLAPPRSLALRMLRGTRKGASA